MDGIRELTKESLQTQEGVNILNDMLRKLYQVIAGEGEKVRVYYGYGSPENAIVANIGSIYMRKDGGAGTSVYIKEADNDLSSGWVAK